VPVEETWDLRDLFQSAEEWEAELAAVDAAIPGVAAYQGRLGEGAGVLLACLEAQEALWIRVTRVATYASLRLSDRACSRSPPCSAAAVSIPPRRPLERCQQP
jgi:oligoendopeptidase F